MGSASRDYVCSEGLKVFYGQFVLCRLMKPFRFFAGCILIESTAHNFTVEDPVVIVLGCELVQSTAHYGTPIPVTKIFYWSFDPKIHEFVGTN